MLAQGLPEDIPDRMLGSLADYAKHPGPTSDTVAKVLGRPALDLRHMGSRARRRLPELRDPKHTGPSR